MSQGNYIKTFEGHCGLPMMVAHAPALGGDLPRVFAALTHPDIVGDVVKAMNKLRHSQWGEAATRMSMPTGVLVIPEDFKVSPVLAMRFADKPLNSERIIISRTLDSSHEFGMRRMAFDYIRDQEMRERAARLTVTQAARP